MKTKPMRKPRPPTDAEVERMAQRLKRAYWRMGPCFENMAREALRLGAKLPKRGKK